MRSILLIPILVFFILFSAFSENRFNKSFYFPTKTKKAGVFDRDSVLDIMPEYHNALDTALAYKKQLDYHIESMQKDIDARKEEFKKYENVWSPFVKETKRKDLDERQKKMDEFSEAAKEDYLKRKDILIQPVNWRLNSFANSLKLEKKLDSIMDKKEIINYQNSNPTAKIINVTNQLLAKVKE